MMKFKKYWLIGIAVIALLAVGLVGCSPNTGSTNNTFSNQQEGIWVTGTGAVKVTPDIATLSIGVNAREDSVALAQAAAAEAMNNVIASLKQNGIADKDIQTQYFNISPVYSWDDMRGTSTIIGYEVTNTVTVTIRDLDKTGTIIDTAAEAGGNLTRINGISFSVDDPTQYYDEAREMAMQDAKDTAQQLAELAGVSLGKAFYITQTGYYEPIYREVYPASLDSSYKTPISPGETTVTLTVQVAFSIK
ncbi:MAG: SIMPL domain-containing protein [Dehalococcoidales bacterium]|nr:SIMPL domain-containing protein [Dehalococcoidales bacterium]